MTHINFTNSITSVPTASAIKEFYTARASNRKIHTETGAEIKIDGFVILK